MQGFNMGRYVPPDLEGVASFNQASRTQPRNLSAQGNQIVRFEMPFAIWCTTCPKETIIGQGVRFNAEKKKIGNYFSTPIYNFRLKHTACGGYIEIHTDPKNTAYVVVSGAKKRNTGEEGVLKEGEVVIAGGKSEEERKRLEADPFARLEEKVGDKVVAASEKTRIQELYAQNSRDWSDPGEANRRLRKAFRVDRKLRNQRVEATEALQERIGFGGEILEENEADVKRAHLVDFGVKSDEVVDAAAKPLFNITGLSKPSVDSKIATKGAVKAAEKHKETLSRDLRTNTRVAMDPFLSSSSKNDKGHQGSPGDVSTLLKRKRDRDPDDVPPVEETLMPIKPSSEGIERSKPAPLVDYDSD